MGIVYVAVDPSSGAKPGRHKIGYSMGGRNFRNRQFRRHGYRGSKGWVIPEGCAVGLPPSIDEAGLKSLEEGAFKMCHKMFGKARLPQSELIDLPVKKIQAALIRVAEKARSGKWKRR